VLRTSRPTLVENVTHGDALDALLHRQHVQSTLELVDVDVATSQMTHSAVQLERMPRVHHLYVSAKAKKRWTPVIAPLSQKPMHPRRNGTRCKGPHSFTCTPKRLFANGTNRAFAYPAAAGTRSPDHG